MGSCATVHPADYQWIMLAWAEDIQIQTTVIMHTLDTVITEDTEDNQTVTQCHHGHADIADNQLVNCNLMFSGISSVYTLHWIIIMCYIGMSFRVNSLVPLPLNLEVVQVLMVWCVSSI